MRCQVDLTKTPLAYKFPQCIVADGLEVGRGKLTVPVSANYRGAKERKSLTRVTACTNSQAAIIPVSASVVLGMPGMRLDVLLVAAHKRGLAATGRYIPSSSGPESQPGL